MANGQKQQYMPMPSYFLQQEETSDDEITRNSNYLIDESIEGDDTEFDEPLIQFKNRQPQQQQQRGIPPNTFYAFSSSQPSSSGISQDNIRFAPVKPSLPQQRLLNQRSICFNQVKAAPLHDLRGDYQTRHLREAYQRQYIDNSANYNLMPSSSSFAPHRFVSSVPVSRSHQAQRVIYDDEEEPYDYEFEDEEETFDEEQPEIYQHRSQQLVHHVAAEQPKVVSNENNRYTIVGHTTEGQPIYALQSVSHSEHPRLQPVQAVRQNIPVEEKYYRIRAQPELISARRIASEYYVCSSNRSETAVSASRLNENILNEKQFVLQEFPIVPSSSRSTQQNLNSSTVIRNKRKSSDSSEKISDSAVAAQAGAIQRFSTIAGWKQMSTWLKTAENSKDWNKLKLLLIQCGQAALTLELLQSNDTPRFVRRLSKICPDIDVRRIAFDLVAKWKKIVASQPVPSEEPKRVGSLKRKTPHPSTNSSKKIIRKNILEKNEQTISMAISSGNSVTVNRASEKNRKEETERKTSNDDIEESLQKNMKEKDEKSEKEQMIATGKSEKLEKNNKVTSNKMNEFNMFEKLGEERKEKKKRPKTAKTYTSKFRSTGILVLLDESIFIHASFPYLEMIINLPLILINVRWRMNLVTVVFNSSRLFLFLYLSYFL
ncbi:unnamed protein product [Dracunculus medinensis]|uniref:TFIIS N-terminal domain-containing protein n=1 Tax=Dracunculus medinensis TaxID=318479 RepID=A0A0N4UC92_DRAME|nr:unnamed protein product [Dracunculus medinensis]